MLGHDGYPGMKLSICPVPPILLKPAHYPDAPAFMTLAVTLIS
jgi:hypothetical protein